MTKSNLLQVVRLPLPCPRCEEEGMETIARLIGHDELPCSFCGEPIDLTAEEWRAYVNEIAEALGHIRPAYQKIP